MILLVTADGLAKLLGAADDIEDIVRDLERKSEVIGICRERRELLLRCPREDCSAAQRRMKERTRLAHMDTAQLLHRNLTVLRREVEHLPADHALGACRTADLVHHAQKRLGRHILLPQDHRERKREKSVPRKNRNPLAKLYMVRRLATPQIVIVHRGQIIVDE